MGSVYSHPSTRCIEGGSVAHDTDGNSVANSPWSDHRFSKIVIGRWTTVDVKDRDAAQLLAHYLETDHPILGLFDADLFLDGITTGDQTYCSSFLVNCVLFWSSVRETPLEAMAKGGEADWLFSCHAAPPTRRHFRSKPSSTACRKIYGLTFVTLMTFGLLPQPSSLALHAPAKETTG